ncbi:hypothetical protein BUALT_Bualt05G0026800 [Buddleja alternifolia]|uniref:Uncharacterized protein n=1 Tax=Buddleja alternifolia TaxID=168488 RepID=A0AAV6XG62_9LAMI|nr:hypothetical protein BUALT_Bualt05G0026800 [Buddleja alternifolia]
MGGDGWSLTANACETASSAAVFRRAGAAFPCDAKIHAHNNLASRHARVLLCEVCERAPAAVTCKADAAALCAACDRDIHSANPLARRHERVPIVPSYDPVSAAKSSTSAGEEFSEEAAEAASWLLPNDEESESREYNKSSSAEYLFGDMDPYLDLDLMCGGEKKKEGHVVVVNDPKQQYCSDGVVPDQNRNEYGSGQYHGPVVDGYPTCDVEYPVGSSKPFMYNFTSQSISQSVSSSSVDVGVVPDHNATADVSKSEAIPMPLTGIDREARVLRYREKRKNRKFEKTIRYASRKAYAETRPRIKGRFAKRSERDVDSFIAADASYSVVPSF